MEEAAPLHQSLLREDSRQLYRVKRSGLFPENRLCVSLSKTARIPRPKGRGILGLFC